MERKTSRRKSNGYSMVAVNMDDPTKEIPEKLFLSITESNEVSKKTIDDFYKLAEKYKNADLVVHVCEEMRPYFNKVFSSFSFNNI